MTYQSTTDNSLPPPTAAAGIQTESETAPLSLSTTPIAATPSSAAIPDQATAVQPRKPSDPFPYTSEAFWEWFRTCGRTDRAFAPFVAFLGLADEQATKGPYKGQRVFKPHSEDVAFLAGILFLPAMLASALLVLCCVGASLTGVHPSTAAFGQWLADVPRVGAYVLCGGGAVVFGAFAAAVALSEVWLACSPLAHLAFDGLSLFPKRIQLTLIGTAAVALTHFLLLATFGSVPFFRVAYALPALAVAVDWCLETLLTRVARRSASRAGERGGEGEAEGSSGKAGGGSTS
ncbi:hypothetical protein JCM6882_002995 [Rhodosporidiobolus microsporus]